MHTIGVTGGVGSGKSTAVEMLSGMGAVVCSADTIAHELLLPGTALTVAVCERFPGECDTVNGQLQIDKTRMGERVFSSTEAREQLNSITHPAIIQEIKNIFSQWNLGHRRLGVAEIPLLFEAGLRELVDTTVVATCSHEVQKHRVMQRGLTGAQAESRIQAQMPLSEKERLADFVVRTDCELTELRTQLLQIVLALGVPQDDAKNDNIE